MSLSSAPIIDLTSLPIDLQALEYFDRLKCGKSNPNKAMRVKFEMDSIACAVVDSVINNEDFSFLKWFSKTERTYIFYLAS